MSSLYSLFLSLRLLHFAKITLVERESESLSDRTRGEIYLSPQFPFDKEGDDGVRELDDGDIRVFDSRSYHRPFLDRV